MLNLTIIILLSYLTGSFPTGVLVGFLTRKTDIRNYGSGNTGATNSFRVLGAGPGIVVAVIDFLKGYFTIAVISHIILFKTMEISESYIFIICTLAVVAGHVKPVFAGFKGGMGFNTAAGAVTAIFPLLAPLCLLVFFLTLTITGHVGVCATVTSFFLPLFYLLLTKIFSSYSFDPVIFVFYIFIFFIVFLSVYKKVKQFFKGEAVLFEKVMIFKRGKKNENK